MNKEIELKNFIEKSNELVSSNYILADIKIVNVLKAIATSETLLGLIKNCLTGFNYKKAKETYFVESKYLSKDKKVFVLPNSQKDIIAFVFLTLMDIDNKVITLAELLDKYFYEDGSSFSQYSLFIEQMIKPFVDTVVYLMQGVISGAVQDPKDALLELERKQKKIKEEEERELLKVKELAKKTYGENLKTVRRILFENKKAFQAGKLSDVEKDERVLVIDKLLKALDKEDKEEITYAFLCYYYQAKAHFFNRQFRVKKIRKLLSEIIYEF